MEQNKTGKPALPAGRYLKYAIGEIILVMIGILLALQINNWNETQKGKNLAKSYAKGLVRDLGIDTIRLNNAIEFHERSISGLNTLINYKDKDLNNPSINDSVHKLFRLNCLRVDEFKSSQNTLTQLKNTGDLVLFKEQVRDSIIAHEQSYNSVTEQGYFYRNAYDNNIALSKKNFDFTAFIDTTYFKIRNNTRIYTGKSFPKANYEGHLKQQLFNEITTVKGISELYLRGYLKPHLEQTKRLIAFLNKENELEIQ